MGNIFTNKNDNINDVNIQHYVDRRANLLKNIHADGTFNLYFNGNSYRIDEKDLKNVKLLICNNLAQQIDYLVPSKRYFSDDNCECVNCVERNLNNEYSGRLKSSLLRDGNSIRYEYFAHKEGKYFWPSPNKGGTPITPLNDPKSKSKELSCDFNGIFKRGSPIYGTFKYKDGSTYSGPFAVRGESYEGARIKNGNSDYCEMDKLIDCDFIDEKINASHIQRVINEYKNKLTMSSIDNVNIKYKNVSIINWIDGNEFKGTIPFLLDDVNEVRKIKCLGLFNHDKLIKSLSQLGLSRDVCNIIVRDYVGKSKVVLEFATRRHIGNPPVILSVVNC